MSRLKRHKTPYPGVFYRLAQRIGKPGEEKVYYIVFKRDGKTIEEKVGRQYADAMTPAKASGVRTERIERKRLSRKEMKAKQLQAIEAEKKCVTLADVWELYQSSMPERKNWATDKSQFQLYLSHFADQSPTTISTQQIDALRIRAQQQHKSPQTVKHILALLKRLIRFGVKKGLFPQPDPSFQYFEMPTVDNEKTEFFTQQQLQNYLRALDEEPDQDAAAFLRLALTTGMRKGALMALQWQDIDFENNFILLRGESAKKGRNDRIPMSQATRSILECISQTESPYVFPGKDGKQRKDFRRIAVRVKKNAGLPKGFRPIHGLRHVYASMLASSGQVDLYTLQKLLTHGSPQMTQRYAHLADEALQRAAAVATSLFTINQADES